MIKCIIMKTKKFIIMLFIISWLIFGCINVRIGYPIKRYDIYSRYKPSLKKYSYVLRLYYAGVGFKIHIDFFEEGLFNYRLYTSLQNPRIKKDNQINILGEYKLEGDTMLILKFSDSRIATRHFNLKGMLRYDTLVYLDTLGWCLIINGRCERKYFREVKSKKP